jgi:hypothetical protein
VSGKKNSKLWIVIVLGILLVAYPLYGKAIGDAIFGTREGKKVISGTVEKIGSDYLVVNGVTIHLKGSWVYKGQTYTPEELLSIIHPGEHLKIEYTENPRWGAMAEKIIFDNGSEAVKEGE